MTHASGGRRAMGHNMQLAAPPGGRRAMGHNMHLAASRGEYRFSAIYDG
jgi:hypothetical protein